MLLLLPVIISICYSRAQKKVDERLFIEKLSLMPPHLSENGRNEFYEFDGHYLVTTRTKSDHTQLGYMAPQTRGILQLKEPLKSMNFEFEIDFSLTPAQGGAGAGFWLSNKLTTGSYYGRNSVYTGAGVIIDTKATPFVQFVNSSGTIQAKKFYPRFHEDCQLAFRSFHNKLHVTLVANDAEYELYDGPFSFSSGTVLVISSSTGNSESVLQVLKVAGYSLKKVKTQYVKGETKKSKKMIMFFGLCCIAGLGYYLYRKQAKDFELKN